MHELDSTRCGHLVRAILEEPDLELVHRPIDLRWYYSDGLQIATNGFLPTSRSLFIATESVLAAAIKNQITPDWRPWINAGWLEYEAAFLVHDYLHVWTFEEAKFFFPELYDYPSEVRSVNLLAFIWILSEAVATVGLDYWFLARQSRGTVASYQLTTTYNPILDGSSLGHIDIQSPAFFAWLANGYLTDCFSGADDSTSQPTWLQREKRQDRKSVV